MNVLSRYLETEKPSALAARVGCAVSTIIRIAERERDASPAMAMKIERATGGKVKASDIRSLSIEQPVVTIPSELGAAAQ